MKRLLITLFLFSLVTGLNSLITRGSSGSESFWSGDEIPAVTELPPNNGEIPLAQLLHNFLAGHVSTGWPGWLTGLQNTIENFNNRNGDVGVTIYFPEESWSGYTLLGGTRFGPEGPINNSTLIDMQGNVIKEWPLMGRPAKLLPGGHVMGGVMSAGSGGLDMAELVQMDWCGNQIWSWTGSGGEGGARWHHDYQREGNPVGYFSPYQLPLLQDGKTLILSNDFPPLEETCPDPVNNRDNCISEMPLLDDVVYEVDWEGNILWEWHAYEHYDQMGFDETAKEAIRTNKVFTLEGSPETDWQHVNAVSYLGINVWYSLMGDERFHPDNIILDGRSSNITAIIARHDHPQGDWQSGDIVWKIGPDFSQGNDEHKLGQIIGQHMAHMIPINLPGGGNILLFDNGGNAGFGSLIPGLPPHFPNKYRIYSRVIEFNPLSLEIVWEYELKQPSEGERKFFSPFLSGAQRLPNTNTLITEGVTGRVFEITQEGKIVWEYIWPHEAPPGFPFPAIVYRAYRVPPWWLPENLDCPE
ncbi:hypothetical protein SCALIN_C01_0137 [Candidatus Scalindua japonica]|uniref:Thioredoxin n=1 Tax=Candidatus Scalindua japonica TaxID=1284222 RepID=A0A286TTK1_9BACT|nr:aryl-sulfate sulfotransferase [Candidatus Scalindua japonica]GAX59206.1 hypothetical protein SCALIN_C01_0137 [Candidatus Scalindua japonica]